MFSPTLWAEVEADRGEELQEQQLRRGDDEDDNGPSRSRRGAASSAFAVHLIGYSIYTTFAQAVLCAGRAEEAMEKRKSNFPWAERDAPRPPPAGGRKTLEIITGLLATIDGNALTRDQALDLAKVDVEARQRRHRVAAVAQR